MLEVQTLIELPPNLSENDAHLLFDSCLDKVKDREWALYHSKYHGFVDNSIRRFINSHSRIPNPLDDDHPMEGVRPVANGFFSLNVGTAKTDCIIVYYLNGAVVKAHTSGEVADYMLFMDETLIKRWGYPEQYAFGPGKDDDLSDKENKD